MAQKVKTFQFKEFDHWELCISIITSHTSMSLFILYKRSNLEVSMHTVHIMDTEFLQSVSKKSQKAYETLSNNGVALVILYVSQM